MNKVICTIFLIMILSFTSCVSVPNNQIQNIENGKILKDGTYTEEGDIWKYGNENATVVISQGKIISINLRKLNKDGKEEEYEKYSLKNIYGNPNLKKFRIDLAQNMLKKQTYDVDSISGATISSENWKRAVQKALIKASK